MTYKNETISVNVLNEKMATGSLNWQKATQYTWQGRDYLDIPFEFGQTGRQLPGNEQTAPAGFNLVLRKAINGGFEGAIRTTMYLNEQLADKGIKTYQTYQLLSGEAANSWLSVGIERKTIATKPLTIDLHTATNLRLQQFSKEKIKRSSKNLDRLMLAAPIDCPPIPITTYQTICWERNGDRMDVACASVPVTQWINDPTCSGGNLPPDTGGGGGTPNYPPGVPTYSPPTIQQIKEQIKYKPFGLIDIDCDLIMSWLGIANFTPDQTIIDKLNTISTSTTVTTPIPPGGEYKIKVDDIARVQNINDAYSSVVNMDYFSVTITQMPTTYGHQWTAGELLNYIRLHINDFTDDNDFNPYNAYGVNDAALWSSNAPTGAIINIDFPMWDNGTVVTSYATTNKWTFTTIHEPKYGDHPVSGNRDFGFVANIDGSYTFYTKGVDRLTSWDASVAQWGLGLPFNKGDELWSSFQNHIKNFVEQYGGHANLNLAEMYRPNWQLVKDVLDGNRPLSDLSNDCPPETIE